MLTVELQVLATVAPLPQELHSAQASVEECVWKVPARHGVHAMRWTPSTRFDLMLSWPAEQRHSRSCVCVQSFTCSVVPRSHSTHAVHVEVPAFVAMA